MNKKSFFEGWYFKHQAENSIISFIPGFNTDTEGNSQAFLQIIMNGNSYSVPYPITDFSIDRRKFILRLGNNSFSKRGIKINIKTEEITMTGKLRFGRILPIRNTIMGFFKYLPGMECKHEIISMYHRIYGEFILNGVKYPFYPGIGYIEKDLGHSFPGSYQWIQCNYFPGETCSVFLSIADIPYHGLKFKGCICAIIYQGKEYRLATYKGVKIVNSGPREICLRQGRYQLKIYLSPKTGGTKLDTIKLDSIKLDSIKLDSTKLDSTKLDSNKPDSHEINDYKRSGNKSYSDKKEEAFSSEQEFSQELYAPVMGSMTKKIKEQHLSVGRFVLYDRKELVFDLKSPYVSYEYVE
jgi:hypothetical protein